MISLNDVYISIFSAIQELKKLDDVNELEIRLMYPMTYELGHMAATILEKNPQAIDINNFIEVIRSNENGVKIRSRTPFDNIRTMHMTPGVLLQYVKSSEHEKKTVLQTKVIVPHKIELAAAKEEPILYVANNAIPPRISFVSQVLCRVGNWMIDYKLKHQLKIDDNQLCSNILSGYRAPSFSLEIEYNGDPKKITDAHISDLQRLVFNQLFMTTRPLDHLYLDIIKDLFRPISKIKMNTLFMKQSVMLKAVDTLSGHLTPKVNGSSCYFTFQKGLLYISSNQSDLWKSFPTAVTELIYGRGEIIDNTIYPFFTYCDKLGTASRLEHLYHFHEIMKQHKGEIVFVEKEYVGPFSSREERCKAIVKLYKTIDYPIDGLIFLTGNQSISLEGTNIVDYKFKEDNTVDLLGVVVMNDLAFVGSPGINKGSDESRRIYVTLFGKENTVIERIGKSYITKNDTLFKFLVETKFFISHFQSKPILHFHKMIVECSIDGDNYIIRDIRPNKNDRYLTHLNMGNTLSMIKELREIQQDIIPLSNIEALGTSFDENLLPSSNSSIVAISENSKTVKIINEGIPILPETPGSAISVLGQFVKTNLIYTACSPIFAFIYPPNKPIKNVLLIDGGSGEDVRKYHSNGASYYLLLDPSKDQLTRADRLFKSVTESISKTQKGNIGTHHTKQMTILNDNFLQGVKQWMPKVDVIDWQFSIQYSWSPSSKEKVVNNLFQISEYGTKLLISCLNGINLLELLKTKKILEYKTSVDTKLQLQYIDEFTYSNETKANKLTEFYVNIDELVQDLHNRGFNLVSRGTFSSMIKQSEGFFEKIYHLETQESTKKFFTLVKSMRMNPLIYSQALEYYNLMEYLYFIRLSK